MSWYERSRLKKLSGLVLVVDRRDRSDDSSHVRDRRVICVSEAWIDISRIEALPRPCDAASVQPGRMHRSEEEILFIRESIVVEDSPVPAKLQRVLPMRPCHVIDELIHWHTHIHCARKR